MENMQVETSKFEIIKLFKKHINIAKNCLKENNIDECEKNLNFSHDLLNELTSNFSLNYIQYIRLNNDYNKLNDNFKLQKNKF